MQTATIRLVLISLVLDVLMGCAPGDRRTPQLVLQDRLTTITESVAIKPGVYRLSGGGDEGAVRIIGDDITVDFQGAELVGCSDDATPDTYSGRGIVIRGNNVTIRNAVVRGYKVGIYAEESPGVTITGCDVSRNYRQRLKSTVEREDLSDWLYGHENDENEWLRYGAGIYLFRCPKATLSANIGRNGQNGICVSRCDDSVIIDNDMSFMSGWGIAMWRTSRCDVSNNSCDWCMRGYSHGVYSRGQDSTGFLVYEQCNDNVFAYNSATHSGDGFFLYAGNETLKKTGVGGCNRNLLYRNDFSHAAANGIECTFSYGNAFVENILNDCTHGVWAGYSYNTEIVGNQIGGCANGISIEHGRDNLIVENKITDTKLGINLWWDNDVDLLASTYGQEHNNCPSTGNRVLGNEFERVDTAVRLQDDTRSVIRWNRAKDVQTAVDLGGLLEGTRITDNDFGAASVRNKASGIDALSSNDDATGYERPARLATAVPPRTRGTRSAFLAAGQPRGRKYIFIDEWGPYDFSDIRIVPQERYGGGQATFQVLGPGGDFTIRRVRGEVTVDPSAGPLPGAITVSADSDGWHPFRVDLIAGGERLSARGGLLRARWTVKFFGWDAAHDPRSHQDEWEALIQGKPLEEHTVGAIDFAWGGRAPSTGVPRDRFATVATATIALPSGAWRVRTISDDGIRVWVDGKMVIDDWTWHAPKQNDVEIELSDGEHTFRIEHFEIDGYAQLQVNVEPVDP